MTQSTVLESLNSFLKDDQISVDSETIDKLSADYYWYSPVLTEMLKDKKAEVVIFVESEEDIRNTLAYAAKARIPLTVRGSGTGNYGQSVPMEGGILLETTRMNKVLEVKKGSIDVETGVILGDIEKMLREQDQELYIYSSTFLEATSGGFFCGGSGGIGSIKWGNLWSGNVIEVKVITMEEEPRKLTITGDDLMRYLHGYGTTGVVSEVIFRTTERVNWMECIYSFKDLKNSIQFSVELAEDDKIDKRSISTAEWPLPSYFRPLKRKIKEDEHVVVLEVNEDSFDLIEQKAKALDGEIVYTNPSEKYHKKISLSNFTFNHVTLWALKADDTITNIQIQYDPDKYLEQIDLIKNKFGGEFLNALDLLKENGQLILSAI